MLITGSLLPSGTIRRIWFTFKKPPHTAYLHITYHIYDKLFGELFPVSFTILLLASVTYEEVLFRGFLLTFFQKLTDSSFLGVFISAFWFGLMHYSSSGTLEENLERLISAFIFGIIYGYLRVKEPQKFTLFSLSIGHFLNDFIALILPAILYA